ncbi:galectin-4-like [Pollicipes pollicipes]|uniref:galectin-4-like n=1 Tax=Pollicipes pollicipes TaxID=41117 RepID=UPI001884FFA9|nr:galectin-4-like [Pollicipes pollicipes]
MAAPIYNPGIPYCEMIPGGPLLPGRMIRIQASSYPNASRFAVNLQVGPNVNPRDDIAMHVNVRYDENCVVRNSLIYQSWGDEERHPNFMPLQRGASFEILILCEPSEYKVAINGQHFCEFRHRMAPQNATFFSIDGDINVTMLAFEGGSPPGAPGYMPAAAAAYGATQSSPYGAPPSPYGAQPSPYGAPPGGYGAAPSPYGAAPSPYGPPPGGYGPQGGYGPPPPPYSSTNPYPHPHGAGGYPAGYQAGGYSAPAYASYGKPHKKDKKSKLAKYGVPLAAGLGGAYVLNKATHGIGHGFGHAFGHGSGSSSSSSSEEE